jgi:hypothetical protein
MAAAQSLKARNARTAQSLEQIPNIGQSVADDLRSIGIKTPRDLIGRNPQQLYDRLCRRTRQDPCVLDTFTSAVRFMEGAPARPWWHYTPERKRKASAKLRRGSDGHVICETPTPGKTAKRIERWKYDTVRKAILASLPRRGPGLLFGDLSSHVEQRLLPDERKRLGSVSWYTVTVKLALEVKGEIVRVKGAVPQRLLRK